MLKRLLAGLLLLILAGAAGFLLYAQSFAEIPAIDPPLRTAFAAEKVKLGEQLAGIGACETCHTKPGGQPFAGGRAFETPFGTIYSTNITPDRETGIGGWSEAAFLRAMREGVDRQGRHLYPVFPYDHFAKVRAADISAIYAYLMTRPAAKQPATANALAFPFGFRPLLAGWKLLFLEQGEFQPQPGQSEAFNRGAYFAEGLGHCGACHSPRNVLGAIDSRRAYAGGEAQNWFAPGLGRHAIAPLPWTKEALANYLIDGWDGEHGVAAGPMIPVVNHLAKQPATVVEAIATYLLDLSGPAPTGQREKALAFARARDYERPAAAGAASPGEAIFASACANCHRRGATAVPLALGTTLHAPDPRNALDIVMNGINPPDGAPEKSMPRFAGSLSDRELADLMAFLRARFSDKPAWTDMDRHSRARRAAK